MKKRTKGILAFAFLGGIMVTSGVVIAIPGMAPTDTDMEFTATGTPADKFPDAQRAQFCGNGTAGSTEYVKEYRIPTQCTQPLAITSDLMGRLWFVQTNTGNVASFNPATGQFSEYPNMLWPPQSRSMSWGTDYSSDNSIWYTDDMHNSLWRFSIDDGMYQRIDFPTEEDSLPQRIEVDGSQMIINDFIGNKIVIMDASSYQGDVHYTSIPSPVPRSVTSSFAKDAESNIWYTNWIPNVDGALVKFDHARYMEDLVNSYDEVMLEGYHEVFELPAAVTAINGVAIDDSGTVWMMDTASSFFYSFDPDVEQFIPYVTSPVSQNVYGNHTGVIKTEPLSRPYWVDIDSNGRIVFNEQAANSIGVFDKDTQKLVEYSIPSNNPKWSDCGGVDECGLVQAFDFTLLDDNIWFTEWAANNIGVVDTSIEPAFDVELDQENLFWRPNATATMTVTGKSSELVEFVSSSTAGDAITAIPQVREMLVSEDQSREIVFSIAVSEDLTPGAYKMLVGARTSEITVSTYMNVIIG